MTDAMLSSEPRQEELSTAAIALHGHALIVVAVTLERCETLGDMGQHETHAEPLTKLGAELERGVPFVAIGHAADDRSPHDVLLRRLYPNVAVATVACHRVRSRFHRPHRPSAQWRIYATEMERWPDGRRVECSAVSEAW